MSIIEFTYNITDFNVSNIDLNPAQTQVVIKDEVIWTNVSDFTLQCTGNLSFWTTPAIFYGNGTGKVDMTHLNSSVGFQFTKGDNNLPQFHLKYSHFDLNEKHVMANFSGNNDVFTLAEMAKDFALPMLVDFLNGTMDQDTMDSISETINGVLGELPSALTIPGTDIVFNFGLLFDPKVKGSYVPMAIDGTAICANKTACRPYNGPKPKVPPETDVFGGNGSFQLLLSDYIFNSLSVAAFEDSIFNLTVTPGAVRNATNGSIELNTDLFGIFIPEMREVYGKHQDITLQLNMTSPPLVSISPAELGISTSTWTTIYVNTSKNETVKAFDIELFTDFKLNIRVADNALKGNITGYKFNLELHYKDIQNVTMDELNSLVNTLMKLAIPQINNWLNEGIALPPIGGLFNLSKSEVTLLPQYVRVDFNPEPIKGGTLTFNAEQLVQKLVRSYKKTKAIKLVKARKPENLPEWLKVEF